MMKMLKNVHVLDSEVSVKTPRHSLLRFLFLTLMGIVWLLTGDDSCSV